MQHRCDIARAIKRGRFKDARDKKGRFRDARDKKGRFRMRAIKRGVLSAGR
jgi:hypothetical protein